MKKGFTLVELLAVLVILGVITLVAVPSVITTNQKSVENEYNEFKKTVENAAEIYMETHIDQKPGVGETKSISVKVLKDAGFINSNLTNPKTKNVISDDDTISVKKENGTITYTYHPQEE